MELCESHLYIGTNEGSILKFSSEDSDSSSLTVTSVRKTKSRDLGPKSPVTFLRAASALDRLLGRVFSINLNDSPDSDCESWVKMRD